MADFRDAVDWKDKRNIWARIPFTKSAVTRAFTAIDKLTEREYVAGTQLHRDSAGRLRRREEDQSYDCLVFDYWFHSDSCFHDNRACDLGFYKNIVDWGLSLNIGDPGLRIFGRKDTAVTVGATSSLPRLLQSR